jgi:hypothetical protein
MSTGMVTITRKQWLVVIVAKDPKETKPAESHKALP